MKTTNIYRLVLLGCTLLASGVGPLYAQREKLPPEDLAVVEKNWPEAKRTYTGLRYIVMKAVPTNTPSPVPGDVVKVLYKGSLIDGTVFDQSPDPEHPLTIRLERGELIEGWDQALKMMHKGEKWLLILPYELAYGTRGRPPSIPRRATLIFEMELLDFGKDLK